MAKVVLEGSKRGKFKETLDSFIKSTNSMKSNGEINPTPALVLALKAKIGDTDEVELGAQL
ncbi:MAG: hypothetical protein ACE5I5_10240, partial [Candidatus Heimdallarchaeota archaeon]